MNLLLTGAFQYTEQELHDLGLFCDNLYFVQDERIPLREQNIDFRLADVNAVVCNALFLHNDVSDFPNLQFVQLTSAGFDRVPLNELQDQGVAVHNARGVYSIPMAEWAVLKLLEIYKASVSFHQAQLNRRWENQRDLLELTDRVVAIFGLGAVGSEIAKRLSAFGCHVIGVDPSVHSSEHTHECHDVALASEVISRSDAIILSLPLTEETRHFINEDRLSLMKQDSVLINMSRGALIKETALIAELHAGKFRGVALDVFEEEPLPQSSPLWAMKNVIITPHKSFVSDKVGQRLYDLMRANLAKY